MSPAGGVRHIFRLRAGKKTKPPSWKLHPGSGGCVASGGLVSSPRPPGGLGCTNYRLSARALIKVSHQQTQQALIPPVLFSRDPFRRVLVLLLPGPSSSPAPPPHAPGLSTKRLRTENRRFFGCCSRCDARSRLVRRGQGLCLLSHNVTARERQRAEGSYFLLITEIKPKIIPAFGETGGLTTRLCCHPWSGRGITGVERRKTGQRCPSA